MLPEPTKQTVTILIESRHLDTDERERSTRVVDLPRNAEDQKQKLKDAVGELYPEARWRTFGGGAATFLDRQHLIVAGYPDLPQRIPNPEDVGRDEPPQESLFAA